MIRFAIAFLVLCFFSSCKTKRARFYAKDLNTNVFTDDPVWNRIVKKYGTDFNSYRGKNHLPLLPQNFFISDYGRDLIEWKNPSNKYPCYERKGITWFNDEHSQTIIWENNLIRGKNGEILRFFYIRKNSDSLIMNYQALSGAAKKEVDSCYLRSFRIYEADSVRMLTKNQYDSILTNWGMNNF